jgi:hypothetical protein
VADSDEPSWPTSGNTGTWLESRVNLAAYKGRRVRIRYLVSALKSRSENWETSFKFNPDPRDDGWWLDDLQVNSALTVPAVFNPDPAPNSTLPGCGAACVSVTANVTISSEDATCATGPNVGQPCNNDADCTGAHQCKLPVNPAQVVQKAPGQPLELNALGVDQPSAANPCQNGGLQYKFEKGPTCGNLNTLVRDFTENPILVDAPVADSCYRTTVRCSNTTAGTCQQQRDVNVVVTCPTTGLLPYWPDITAIDDDTFDWAQLPTGNPRKPTMGPWQARYGPLPNLPNYTTGAVLEAGLSNAVSCYGTTTTDPDCTEKVNTNDPTPANGRYFIFARDDTPSNPPAGSLGCNENIGWTSGGAGELNNNGETGRCDDSPTGGNYVPDGAVCDSDSDCSPTGGGCLLGRDSNTTLPPP